MAGPAMSTWLRGYHRRSDDSDSVYLGHRSYAGAVKDAQQCFMDDDIDEVWVQRKLGARTYGPKVFHLITGPGACPMCGWPPGQGHAPGARCAPDNGVAKIRSALEAWEHANKVFHDAGTTPEMIGARTAMHVTAADLAAAVRDFLDEESQ